jgi:serine protease
MASSTDTDYFKVTLPAGKTLASTLTPNSTSDYDLYIYNSAGTQVTSSTNGSGSVDSTSVINNGTTSATVYIRVVYYSGGTGSTSGKYTLKLTW